jgi:transcriptional antiterminator/mannitol/fructose-specific phosphotransferase system IIA component
MELKSYVPQIINTILQVGTVHYSDIEKLTGKSKKTVAKYLDEVEATIREYDVRLVRKRNVGVYFEGDTKRLAAAIGDVGLLNEQGSKSQRHLSLISKLLLTKQAQRIQDLADDSYVSRSTFEADLRDAKAFLEKYGARLSTSNEGIQIVASERVRRRLMAELLNMYWGQPAYIGNRRANTHKQIQVPGEISEFFSRATLDKVLGCLDEFEKETGVGLSDYEYQSLAVHLVIAIERIKRDEVLKGIPERSKLEAATETLSAIIEQSFSITIPDDEKQYLNIHVLAAEENDSNMQSFDSQSVTPKDNVVSDFLRKSLTQYDEILIHNLTLYLVPALKRISLGLKLRNPYTEDTKRFFPLAYKRAVDSGIKLKEEFNADLNDDEIAFIALHIEALIERDEHKTTAVLVCSTGLGTARLLEQRMKKYFSTQIDIKRVTSVQELRRSPITEDLVISTINIEVDDKPVIVVPPFLDAAAVARIDDLTRKLSVERPDAAAFITLLRKRLITFADKPMGKEEAIRLLGDQIERTEFGEQGISDAAIEREKMASTAITTVAVPHAPIEFVRTPCIAILINPAGIRWDSHDVKIVFFLAMNKKIKPHVDKIYTYFNEVLENQRMLAQLEKATNPEKVIEILGGGLND